MLLTAALCLLTIVIPEDLPARPMPSPQSPGWLEVGGQFPDILLPRLDDGEPSSISAFRGKRTILHLFASW